MRKLIHEWMRRNFAIATSDESLASARETMRLGRLRHLPVTQGGTLLGLLSYRDLLERLLEDPDALELACVADVMRRAPASVAPEASLDAAADCMCRYGLGCLPVVDRDQLVGLVTEADLLRAAYRLQRA